MNPLTLHVLPDRLVVCRLAPDAPVPDRPVNAGFWSVTRTGDELSIVLSEGDIPAGCQAQPGWRCLRVEGPLDFGLTGILASLATPLAEAGVSIFVISTYDTDYVLVKDDDLDRAKRALVASGHRVG
jgi:hypothetical protein